MDHEQLAHGHGCDHDSPAFPAYVDDTTWNDLTASFEPSVNLFIAYL